MNQQTTKYNSPPPHAKPADAGEFLAAATDNERRLHEIAERFLGTSYFMDRTHGYIKWLKSK